jgi:serine/threonine-protein kinase
MVLEGRIEEAFAYLEQLSDQEHRGNNSVWVTFARVVVWTRDRDRALKFRHHPGIKTTDFSSDLLEFLIQPDDRFLEHLSATPAFTSPHATWRGRALFFQGSCELSMLLGRHEAALKALEMAIQVGLFDLLWVDGCPLLAPLRQEPRFQELRAVVAERARLVRAELGLP